MIATLKSLFGLGSNEASARALASVPPGERYYAVGDIHGRRDLFDALMEAVDEDDAQQGEANTTVVLLGDLVDRGPDSAGVVRHARAWAERRNVRFLAGNHEEMFLESFEDTGMLRHFLKHGGRETLLSYGISREVLRRTTIEELQDEMRRTVPAADINFLRGFEELIVAGDYAFVHAGIDPTKGIDEQSRGDMLWIRERFLRHDAPLSHTIVHGHTIAEEVEQTRHRIGLDTGAFRTGVLTALVLEGTGRRILQALENDGAITLRHEEG